MLKMKYKVISAAMVIAPLFLSTGFATTVQACPTKAPIAVHKVVRKAAPKPVRNIAPKPVRKAAPKPVHKGVVKLINKSKHKVAPKVAHKAVPRPITQVQHR